MLTTEKKVLEIKNTAKVWVFTADRLFSGEETEELEVAARNFSREWTAHKVALQASTGVLYNTFLVIAVDEDVHSASGCSIDDMHHFVKSMERNFKVNLFDRMRVVYREGEKTGNLTLGEFEKKYREGEVNGNTPVFNTLVNSGADLSQKFLIPLRESWLAARLKI